MKTNLHILFILFLFFYAIDGYAGGPSPAPCNPITNELCGSATAIAVGGCSGAGSSGCNVTGDPGGTSCGSTGTGSAWFSFVAPASGSVDITTTLTAGYYSPIVLYSGACGAQTEVGCFDPMLILPNPVNPYTGSFTGLTPGVTYHFILNSPDLYAGGDAGQTSFSSICVADPGGGGCTLGTCLSPTPFVINAPGGGPACTNDCNTGALPGPTFTGGPFCYDLPNPTVWYTFTTDATATTIDIDLTSATDLSDPEFTLFTTPDCSNFTIIDCVEGTAGAASSTGLVITPSTTYILAVSDATGDIGDFDLCVTQTGSGPANCVDNNECATAATITLNASGGGQSCITDCNTGASPGEDGPGNNCYDAPNATVWYTFTTDATTATINIDLTSTDLTNPVFTVWTSNCPVTTYLGTLCGVSTATGVSINPSTTYYIAISDDSGTEGNFDLCLEQFEDQSACNTNDIVTVTGTSFGSPLAGPYQPGETVSFCYTINGWITLSTNCNYLQAIIPTFGACWDPTSFDPQGQPTVTTPLTTQGVIVGGANDGLSAGTWDWFPAGSVNYNLPGPSNTGLVAGDDVGAGWYFATSYQAHGGAPDNSYGDHNIAGNAGSSSASCADASSVWQICFDLVATSTCVEGLDCSIALKTYADGEIGIWADIGCTADLPASHFTSLTCILLTTGLEEFYGKSHRDKNLLSWTVNEQLSVDQFEVEKSSDGITWGTTGIVEGITNNTTYSYTDNSPYTDVTYYRLKIKDFNGDITGSQVIAVTSPLDHGAGLTSELSPNPASSQFKFTYTGNNLDEDIHIQVVNMVGQTMINYSVPVADINEIFEIETSSLADGFYSVNISQGSLKTVKRISIMR